MFKKFKAINLNITGVKCDNEECDYSDDTAEFKDYKRLLNEPCPLCGDPLLTEADYKATKRLKSTAFWLNILFFPVMLVLAFTKSKGQYSQKFDMDGTGKVHIGELKEHK